MKAFQNSERIVVRVKINNHKIDEFNTRVNEAIIDPRKVVNCFNNIPSEQTVVELVDRIKKILAFQVVKDILYNDKIEEVLDTAKALAPTVTIENEIKRLRKWLPYIPLIKDPVTNVITKTSTSRNKDFSTYDQLLATTFANAFISLGIATFSAKMAHQ